MNILYVIQTDLVPEMGEQKASFLAKLNLKIAENLDKLNQKTQELKTTFHNLEKESLANISQYKQELDNIKSQATESFKTNLTETTNNLTNQIISVTEKSKTSLKETIDKAENLSNNLSEKINISLDGVFDSWIQEHPLFNWLLTHPMMAIIIVIISLLLTFTLGQVLIELVKQLLIAILRTPWLISKFVFLKSVNKPLDSYNSQTQTNILQRLEAIEQKQQAILEQLSNFNSHK
jgi:hypothetical protein